MVSLFSNVIALFITVPLLSLIVIFWVSAKVTRNKKRSFHFMIDVGTIIFILAVHYLVLVIWEISILWMIAIFILLLTIFIMFIHYKKRGDIEFKRVRKVVLRLNFLLFSFTYVILLVYGLVMRIVA
ncbi:DUF3397 domain-containing protein [Bacillus tianshenii]|nr:DUF3397 domain-containing protein [Bacillus tianshenii]